MHILVTGGAGYIGSHAVKLFLGRGHQVWVYDNLSLGHRSAVPSDRLIVGDLGDCDQLDQALATNRIDAVVHFAAFTHVGESVIHPSKYYQNNVVNTFKLMDGMRRHNIWRFVLSSTAAVYGVPERVPITEDLPKQPINPYGKSKLYVEQALADYAAAYGFGYAALRYFNAAGAHPDASIGEDHNPETHLIPLVLQVALGQRPCVEIFGADYPTPDGTCVRDYIHVADLAEAHLVALEHLRASQGLSYNLGIGRGYSVREVIQVAQEITGTPIAVRESRRRPGDPPVLVASSQAIQRELGWRPRYTDLGSIVETAWKWHGRNPKGYADPRPISRKAA